MASVGIAQEEVETQDFSKMDTVEMARKEREQQGPWELEVTYGFEPDLQKHLQNCKKNPNHLNFIPAPLFNADHLPPGYRDEDLVDCIQTLAALTVRVTVKFISDRRPRMFPDSDRLYPYYENRGKTMVVLGSGWVYDVDIYGDEGGPKKVESDSRSMMTDVSVCNAFSGASILQDDGDDGDDDDDDVVSCECKECLESGSPKRQFATLSIYTAAHVVFDDQEAKQTSCHLFFDEKGMPETCAGVVKLTEMSCTWSDVKSDRCILTCVTHDLELARRLRRLTNHWRQLQPALEDKFPSQWSDRDQMPTAGVAEPDKPVLTVIVSHPHGCSKQVTIGHSAVRRHQWHGWTEYRYSTPTCPGSSGAHVLVVGGSWRWWDNHVHAGACPDDKQFNYSAYGFD